MKELLIKSPARFVFKAVCLCIGLFCLTLLPKDNIVKAQGLVSSKSDSPNIVADGTIDTTFSPQPNGDVNSIAIQADGRIIIAGAFSQVNGVSRGGITRLNKNGSLDNSFNSTGSGTIGVNKMALLNDGKILILGSFTSYNGVARPGFARLNNDGSLDMTFNPDINVNNGEVVGEFAVFPNGGIVVSGNFNRNNGNYKVVLMSSSGVIGSIIADANSNYSITKLAVYNGEVLVASLSTGLHLYKLNGEVDSTFQINPQPGSPNVLQIQRDGKILTNDGNELRRYNTDGSLDFYYAFSIVPTTSPRIYDIKVQPDGKIVVGGLFQNSATAPIRKGIGRINTNGSLDTSFNSGDGVGNPLTADASVYTIALQTDGKILAGGTFFTYDNNARSSIVRITNQSITPRKSPFDFDFDGKTDISSYNASTNVWQGIYSSDGSTFSTVFGTGGDKIVPADYDGDGRADIAVFRASDGTWYYLKSSDGIFQAVQFGLSGDVPLPADFDADGKADFNVWRPSSGDWYRLNSGSGYSFSALQFGASGDKPVTGDFDGDGKADQAIYRPSEGLWFVAKSSDGTYYVVGFGLSTDVPVPADYDGDGKADVAVWRPSDGYWYRFNSGNGQFAALQFGAQGDKPAVGDFDGDGKTEQTIFRPSTNAWFILRSSDDAVQLVNFGSSTDTPIPSTYVP